MSINKKMASSFMISYLLFFYLVSLKLIRKLFLSILQSQSNPLLIKLRGIDETWEEAPTVQK